MLKLIRAAANYSNETFRLQKEMGELVEQNKYKFDAEFIKAHNKRLRVIHAREAKELIAGLPIVIILSGSAVFIMNITGIL